MKSKILLVFLLILIIIPSNGQNWQVFNSERTYNYSSEEKPSSLLCIFCDSISLYDGDSVFYLSRIVKKKDDETYLSNQPQFLMHKIIVTDSSYIFSHPKQFEILKDYENGKSWTFCRDPYIEARWGGKRAHMSFGENDSLAAIILSTNDSILISMKYGIYTFGKVISPLRHQLLGINDIVGVQQANFRKFYDFDAGDVFEFSAGSGDPGGTRDTRTRWTILERIENDTSLEYLIHEQSVTFYLEYLYKIYGYVIKSDEIKPLVFKTPELDEVYYQDQLINLNSLLYYYGVDLFSIIDVDSSFQDKLTVSFGRFHNEGLILAKDQDIDSLLIYQPFDPEVEVKYVEGLGMVSRNWWDFEIETNFDLVACKKADFSFGTLKPDEYYLDDHQFQISAALKVYPNPAVNYVKLEVADGSQLHQVDVFNLQGALLYSYHKQDLLDISDLPAGIYLLNVLINDRWLQQRLVKR